MDYIAYILIIIFGIFPPFIVGYWSYKQGGKGAARALQMRDEALQAAKDLREHIDAMPKQELPKIPTVQEFIDAMPEVKIPEEQFESLKASVTATMKGILGNLIKQGKNAGENEIQNMTEEFRSKMTPQERVQDAIMGKIMGFLG